MSLPPRSAVPDPRPLKGRLSYTLGADDDAAADATAPVATPAAAEAREEPFLLPARGHSEHHGVHLRIAVDFDGETLALHVEAHRPVLLLHCRLDFEHHFVGDERVLMNGYQSWTDTTELGIHDRMRGLDGMPRSLVDRFVLDGGGDYRFTDYSEQPGCFHGYTYAMLRAANRFVLVGSLGEEDGFTLIRTDCSRDLLSIEKECPARALRTGERWEPNGLAFVQADVTTTDEEEAYDRWFSLAGIQALDAPPLIGYTSWYRHYDDIGEAKLECDLASAAKTLADFDCDGLARVFQIDDGYAKVGDWAHADEKRFPRGMGALADSIAAAGLLPGLWVAPFVCEKDSHLFAAHPDWLARDETGALVRTGCHWSGGFALDTLNPSVRAYIRDILRMMTQEWGFRLIKADFLYAACLVPHGGLNRGQLMADAIDLLREELDAARLLCCGVPLGSVFGKTDYCRIGCDVGLDWDGPFYMRRAHRERVSTKRSMADTIARAPLDGRAFGCDPDVFFLRGDVRLSDGQRRALIETDAACGRVLLTSDNMTAWSDKARTLYGSALRSLRQRTSCPRKGDPA